MSKILHDWFLWGTGYQFWSGFGSDFGEITLIGAVIVMLRKHNCHVDGCKSVLTHMDPEVHAPACGRHHSHRHKRGIAR